MTSKTKAVASMAGALVIFSIPIAGAYALDKGFGQAILILVLAAAGSACMWWAGRIFFNSAKDFAQTRRRMKAEAEEKAWLAQQPYRKGQFVQTLVGKGTDLPANSVGCVLRVFDDWGDTVFVVAFANGIQQHFSESEIRLHSENILILEEVGVSVDAPTDLDQYYRDLAKLADPDTLEPVDEPFNLQDSIEDIEGGIADIASELALLNSYQGTIRIAIGEIVDAMKANQSGFGAGAADRITPEQLHGTTTAKEPPKEDAGPHVIDAPAKAGNRMVLTKPYQWLASDPLAPRGTMVAKVDERVGEYKVRIFFANHERDYRDAWVKDAYFE